MSKQYRLNALDTFTCIGGDCPNSCCKNWDIDVDEETYRKWQALDDNNIAKEMLMNSIRTAKVNDKEIYILEMDENKSCFHLDQEGLCSIQQQLGVDMMPSTCREYPRKQYNSRKRKVHSATLSCPEIVRQVLFSNDKRVYDIKGNIPRPLGKDMTSEKVYWHLEKTATNVFAANNFPLNIKLTYLARVLAETTMMGLKGTLNDDMLKSYSSQHQLHMSGLRNAVSNREFGTNPANARYMWYVILTALAMSPDFNEKLGLTKSIEELFKLYKSSDGNAGSSDHFYKKIQDCKQQAHPMMLRYEDAFKRYLQTVFVSKAFPWMSGDHGYLNAFLLCVIPFAAVQLVAWLYTEKHQRILEEDLIAIINGIEGRFGHSSEVMKNIENNKDFYQLELYFDWFLDVV